MTRYTTCKAMLKENKKKGEVQFLKMTWFDVLNNVERKQKEKEKFNF